MEKWKKIIIIGGAITVIGTLLTYTTKVSVYIEAPTHIKANAEDIYDIQSWVNEQRIANKIMQEMQQQQYSQPQQRTIYNPQTEPYCEWEGEIKWCWDEKNREWWRAL